MCEILIYQVNYKQSEATLLDVYSDLWITVFAPHIPNISS